MVEFFTFPSGPKKRNKRSYPVEVNYEGEVLPLTFAFIETGCRHLKKRAQLRNKKELFLKFWSDTYKETDVNWIPRIYRILSHYKYLDRYPKELNKFSCDVIIHHKEISPDMLSSVDDVEKKYLRRKVRKRNDQDILEDIISRKDAQGLHQMIAYVDAKNELSNLRGKIAEYFAQKTIASIMNTQDIVRYNNEPFVYLNKRYKEGTEIDQVLQFYGVQPYVDLVDKLSQLDSVDVVYDKPDMNRYINKAV